MNTLRTALVAVALAVGVALPGQTAHAAAVLTIAGGTEGMVARAAGNDLLGPLFGRDRLSGVYGGRIGVSGASPGTTVSLVFDLLGYEAGFDNGFVADGAVRFTTPKRREVAGALDAPLAWFELTDVLEGLIDFGFGINRTDGVAEVRNGANPDDAEGAAGANFFASIGGDPSGRSGRAAYLFLDDGGAGPDDDHDDLAVRVTLVETPTGQDVAEPATMALLGIGLVGAGLAARRRLSGEAGAT